MCKHDTNKDQWCVGPPFITAGEEQSYSTFWTYPGMKPSRKVSLPRHTLSRSGWVKGTVTRSPSTVMSIGIKFSWYVSLCSKLHMLKKGWCMCWGDHIYSYNTTIHSIYISAIRGQINDLNTLINIWDVPMGEDAPLVEFDTLYLHMYVYRVRVTVVA